ncbi:hypothetical protein EJ04DRAFT_557598 [Polyplosphaeria fusca]|uniref:Thymidylate kinase protein n=1 Tax=Polyplosphaeria fusca TaxID=682080 RepID=A0A9P4QIV5_9PLEO|nr:hypothetical protein EJ04DRAFT_557598 [Polyplosphaeria fusca]
MALSTRQPFAEIGSPRLQALSSAKNRQNAIAPSFSSPLKPTQVTGKRRAPSVFDEHDSENVDPSVFNSPTKKSKNIDGFSKPSKFALTTSPSKPSPASFASTPAIPSVRQSLSSPNTSTSTPILHSRGSPKHKRIGLLSKRRASSSPFRRIDPPTFTHPSSSPALPFSIDAALKGTLPSYTPKSTTANNAACSLLDDPMPKGWFFAIHEDSPEQEASNILQHSASILDISSDDDAETKKANEASERGKENIPPEDFVLAQPRHTADSGVEVEVEHVKFPRLRKLAQDAMDEDRKPLADLPAKEFYGEGVGAGEWGTVEGRVERGSGLKREFEFSCVTMEKGGVGEVDAAVETADIEDTIPVFVDGEVGRESEGPREEQLPAPIVEAPVETCDVAAVVAAP